MSGREIGVVITGLGVVAPNGMNVEEFYTNCVNGVTGICESEIMNEFSYRTKYAAEVQSNKNLRWEAKYKAIGELACEEMLKDSNINKEYIESFGYRNGFCMASANIGSLRLEPQLKIKSGLSLGTIISGINENELSSREVLDFNSTDCCYHFSDILGIKGPVISINTACASGNMSVGTGYRMIKTNQLDIVVAAGVDILSDLSLAGFNSMANLSENPCCPFDKKHNGITIGEGAAFMLLEREDLAIKRGAKIYGRIFGYTTSNDAYHITAPDPSGKGALWCMSKTLKNRGLKKGDKLYINTHGTSTKTNDSMELKAMEDLGKELDIDHIWFSSTKSMIGHCLGASGSLELLCSVKGLEKGKMPLSISVDDKVEFDENKIELVNDSSKSREYNVLLSNSFAFAGNSSAIGVERWEGLEEVSYRK